ncbi:uncharacterized [Tachysurus ichikawai]
MEATSLLAKAWIPWRKSKAIQMVTVEGCLVLALVDLSRAVMLAELTMLACQSRTMGNLLVAECIQTVPMTTLFTSAVMSKHSVQRLFVLSEEDRAEEVKLEDKIVKSIDSLQAKGQRLPEILLKINLS